MCGVQRGESFQTNPNTNSRFPKEQQPMLSEEEGETLTLQRLHRDLRVSVWEDLTRIVESHL